MPTYLLEVHGVDVARDVLEFGQPVFEAQEAHAAAFETLGFEADKAVSDLVISGFESPAGGRTEVKRQGNGVRNGGLLHGD